MAAAAADPTDPAAWSSTLRSATLNGIRMRWADTAQSDEDYGRPAVLFMHGWPESWFSWRHQLKAVLAAGFLGIAPDMRGYGGTSAPEHVAEYNVYALAGDMLALLQHLGVAKAALVGHDHGANLGWKLALLHADVFPCYAAMSVPYAGRPAAPILESYRKHFGDERRPEDDPGWFYMLHHNLPNAAADYARGTRETFRALYGDMQDAAPAPIESDRLFVEGRSEPMWRRMKQPKRLSPWISEAEVEYYVQEYEKYGWEGGLNWYRVFDIDWVATPQLQGRKVKQPVAFIAGAADAVIMMYGGIDKVKRMLSEVCAQQPRLTFIDGAGHWIQQECPREVNEALLQFLAQHAPGAARQAVRSRL